MSLLIKHVSSNVSSIVSLVALIIFLPLFLLVVSQTYTLFTKASGTPANIVVDTTQLLEPINTTFFHAFAQGGEERGNMLASIESDVKALRPKLIRLDHIYDLHSVVSRTDGQLTFDWTALDTTLASIQRTGATPLISLSYMPSVIAKEGSIINPPNDWNEWAFVVQKTIEHISGRGNLNIPGVYYEVWNEPDLAQFGGWKMQGEKNYLTLYQYAAAGAQRARNVAPFSFGGPATTGMYTSWITALARSGARVDFFSWHSYIVDPETYADDQRALVKALLPYPSYTLLPKLITEFGFDGAKNPAYGTMYAAAHTAAVVRQLISGGPTYLFSFELKDGPQDANNGWGLISHDSTGLKKKPRYYIYPFLDAMAGTRLSLKGEGSWVSAFASVNTNVIRVLLVNFDPKGSHSETVPVTFTGLTPATYALRQRIFLGRDTTNTYPISDTSLSVQVILSPQAIALLELTKTQ